MKLRTLSIFEFDNFARNHPLGNYHQTSNYALLASEQGYDYDMLGLVDENNNIVAASLILIKKISFIYRYGYAPKGFLIDYFKPELLSEFTKALKKYYYKKNVIFIKVNPEISIGQINDEKKQIIYNNNKVIESTLEGLNFRKLKSNNHFETKIPKFNAVLVLKNSSLNNLSKNTRNKINKGMKFGLSFVKGTRENIEDIYKFVKNKKTHSINHYYNYFNAFNKTDEIDIFLVKINFEECLINLREKYELENDKNIFLVNQVMENPSEENLRRKLASDEVLETYRTNIAKATKYLAENKEKTIAGAITIKYNNRVYILISGYDLEYKSFSPNYFLHYMLIEHYKKDFDYMDLNGITGDFSNENPYKGLDRFKKGFKPLTFEYIGELDFIINNGTYTNLDINGILAREFKRKEKTNVMETLNEKNS